MISSSMEIELCSTQKNFIRETLTVDGVSYENTVIIKDNLQTNYKIKEIVKKYQKAFERQIKKSSSKKEMNEIATQSPDFSHGVEERHKNNAACYIGSTHCERDFPEADIVQTARETEASGNSPCGKTSGQDLCGQVSADVAPRTGVENESVRNPQALAMGRFNLKLHFVPEDYDNHEEIENIAIKINNEFFKAFGMVKNIASGKAKVVSWYLRADEDGEGIVSKAIYTSNGVTKSEKEKRRKELKKEFNLIAEINERLGADAKEGARYLAINLKKMTREDVGIEEDFLIETDLADGDLEKKLREDLSYAQRVKFGAQLIRSYKYIHKIGFAHGDPKPENLLIFDDRAKLSDFGKTEDVRDGSREYRGNLRFGPPERKLSKKGDVYGVALMLVRIFEDSFLGEKDENGILKYKDGTLLDIKPKYRKEGPVNKAFRGVEKFVVIHKKFLVPNKPEEGTAEGTLGQCLREGPCRVKGRIRWQNGETRQIQEKEIHEYIDKLIDEMYKEKEIPGVGQGIKEKLSPIQASNLQNLLKWMTANDPSKRPPMEKVESEYKKIFPESFDN